MRQLRRHVDGLVLRIGLVLGRADRHAQPAAGAILRGHLDGELLALELRALVVGRLEGRRAPWPGSAGS